LLYTALNSPIKEERKKTRLLTELTGFGKVLKASTAARAPSSNTTANLIIGSANRCIV
jgi:hypothetical protein